MRHSQAAHQSKLPIGRRQASIILALTVLLLLASVALAQGGYDLPWWSVDGGATFSRGGGYTLGGSIGQSDAGTLSGGDYTLLGGFWGSGAGAQGKHYLPLLRH